MLKDAADKFSLETMIFQVGSEVLTHKPGAGGDTDVEEVEGENDLNEKTPRQKKVKQSKAGDSEEPYETPVILRTKPWAPSVAQVDDTEADSEDSEIERLVTTKRKKTTRVSSEDTHGVNN